jgi:hypothetical protein
MYGIIEYNDDGQPKCEICGQYYDRVSYHVRQAHEMSAREYKVLFGFDIKKGICSRESASKTRVKTLGNYDKCIASNLIEGGMKTRRKKGDPGRTKDQVSEQTRRRLKDRLKEPYMVEAMKKSGYRLGKSGLGNKKRWGADKLQDS